MKKQLIIRLMGKQSAALDARKEINQKPLTATIKETDKKDTNQTKMELADGSIAIGFDYSASELRAGQSVRYQNGQILTKTGINR